ncbi:hypothetical protein HWI79_2561 [Cryptosporidium felis]|nr:hypothetical protein HWI79_2561 [Cryptosporidium felis]
MIPEEAVVVTAFTPEEPSRLGARQGHWSDTLDVTLCAGSLICQISHLGHVGIHSPGGLLSLLHLLSQLS